MRATFQIWGLRSKVFFKILTENFYCSLMNTWIALWKTWILLIRKLFGILQTPNPFKAKLQGWLILRYLADSKSILGKTPRYLYLADSKSIQGNLQDTCILQTPNLFKAKLQGRFILVSCRLQIYSRQNSKAG